MRFFWFVILPAVLLGMLASSLPVAIYAAVFGAVLMALIAPSDKDNDNGNADRGGDSGERRRYLADRVDDLEDEVRELRRRLAALERRQSISAAMPEQQAAQKQPATVSSVRDAQPETAAANAPLTARVAESSLQPPAVVRMPAHDVAQKQPAPEVQNLPAEEEPLVWAGYELVPESQYEERMAAQRDRVLFRPEELPADNAAAQIPADKTSADKTPAAHTAPVQKQPARQKQAAHASSRAASGAPSSHKIRPQHSEPAEPNPLLAWFLSGNPLLKTGALVLFFGLAFLLSYVGGHLPLSVRYLAVFGAGVAAAGAGVKLQSKKREYGLTLQGFGLGVMYLTTLAAAKLHALIGSGVAFVVMVALVLVMIARAVSQDAKVMAQAALVGGLAAPVLVGGGGSHIVLFGYLALLNAGVAAIAWFKAWRSLNLIGLSGTFVIASSWGAARYHDELFASSELFLIYHWLLYTLIACLFARKTLEDEPLAGSLKRIPDNASLERIWQTVTAYGSHIGILDSSLLFGSALTSFSLQYALMDKGGHGAAYSALLWAAVYGGAALYFARLRDDFAVMKQAFAGLFLVFVTLAVPLAFELRWTAMAWALEAAMVYSFGLIQRQPQTRVAAVGVYGLAALSQLKDLLRNAGESDSGALLNGSFSGALIAAASGVLMYWAWARMRREDSALWEKNGVSVVLLLALIHAVTLPMLVFGRLGCTLALAVYALAFAAAQWRQKQPVFSGFSAACVLISFLCSLHLVAPEKINIDMALTGTAILYLATAFTLHKARWQREEPQFGSGTQLCNLGAGCLMMVLAWVEWQNGLGSLARIFNMEYGWAWAWFAFAALLLLGARGSRWREGVQAASLAMWLFAVMSIGRYADIWATEVPLAGSLLMLGFSVLAALSALWQPETRHPDGEKLIGFAPAVHAVLLPTYILLWTQFSGSLAEAHWPNALPLARLAIPFTAWLALTVWRDRFGELRGIYWRWHSALLAVYAALWFVHANFARPPQSDFPYFSVFNAVEIGSIAVLYLLYRWLGAWLPESSLQADGRRVVAGSLPALFLLLLSGGVMRLWHIFGGVDWRLDHLLASFGVQASLSIVWALAAIVLMVSGNRAADRARWLVGASIMAVVVLKLFFVELGNSGGIERIVSFIVVGLLLLLVGWYAPVPPKDRD